MGELSAARHALEGDPISPENQQTLRTLQDPNRLPAILRSPLPPAILNQLPEVEFDLSQEGLLTNLRFSRRGAAGGPSGMTADHIRTILNSERHSNSFWRMCQEFARGRLLEEILRAVITGRMTALQKPQSGIRGIVVGDFVRRLVARTLAQQFCFSVERHTSPYQFALSNKSGCECVTHIAQAMTDLDPNTTLLSVDGIGAFDLISREAVLQGLSEVEGDGSVLLFVKLFYSSFQCIGGQTMLEALMRCGRGEAENRTTPLSPLCTLVANTGPSSMSAKSCWFQIVCSRSWMTCTCVVALIVLLPFTSCWDERCGTVQGSNPTKEKHSSGTEAALPPMGGKQ